MFVSEKNAYIKDLNALRILMEVLQVKECTIFVCSELYN